MYKKILIKECLNVFGDIIGLKNPYLDLNYVIVMDERIFYSIRDKITLFNGVKYSYDIKTISNTIEFDIEDTIFALGVFSIYNHVVDNSYNYVKDLTINGVSILDSLVFLKEREHTVSLILEPIYDNKVKQITSMTNISAIKKSILFDNILNELPTDYVIYTDFYKKIRANLKNKNNVFKLTLGLSDNYKIEDVNHLFNIINFLSYVEVYNYSSDELPEVSNLRFNRNSENLLKNDKFKEFEVEYNKTYKDLRELFLSKVK